ncbi:hypothetical protein WJX72_009915 [[Myrmecia] bisecta]|uniref:Peptidyl-prolyl cis-trans isomerase n=1 Tax=[Myrmecia] bisecta TaxID=41462 RepID=A0AAW1P6I2_9CHLO
MSKASLDRAYIDIDIGDSKAYEQGLAAFERGSAFFESIKDQYGLSGTLSQQNTDNAALVEEAYAADPNWASQGPFSAEKPAPLRAGRIVVELNRQQAPKAVENFVCLCTGERGVGKSSGKPLHYKGNRFHRIVKGFVCQGGDIVRGDGSSGDSIYGGKFNDDKGGLKLPHDAAGVVGMANSGKNSNTSQFYFTLAAAPQCNGKQVVVGRVVEGLDILRRIDEEAASADGTPRQDVVIADCGVLLS